MDLRVLFVEDSADDAELMLRRLREAGIEPHWDRVQTEAALREALIGERWELALVDYNLPGFGGPRALAVLAEAAPDVPAITVSGAITEETAVATITAGAVDYVLKDNLTRLAPAVRRAVEGAELRRQQRRAAEQARQTMYAIEHSSQAIVYVSEGGVVLYLNAAAQRLGGGLSAESVGQEIWDWTPMVDEKRWGELWRAASQRPIVDFETTARLPGGEERLISATLDYHERDEDSFVIVYARDITEQREVEERAKESEEQYRQLFESASDAVFVVAMDTSQIIDANSMASALYGYDHDELLTKKITDLSAEPEETQRRVHEAQTRPSQVLTIPLRLHCKRDGTVFPVEITARSITWGKQPVLLVACRDITERKQAEEEIRRMALAVDTAPSSITVHDFDGRFLYANQRTFELHGYSRDEFLALKLRQLDVPAAERLMTANMQKLRECGEASFEAAHFRKDGTTLPVEVNAKVTTWGGKEAILSVATDLTERKQAEEEIRRQAQQLRRTVEGAVLAMSLVVETRDPYTAGHERRVAELATAIAGEMGMDGEELTALRLGGLIHDIGKIAVPAEILAKPGRLSEVEFSLIKQHPASGFDILAVIDFGRPVAEIVRQHHERLDGSGYPRGLAGEDILPGARILAVADVVEAMSSHRPYRAALGMEAALAEIREHAGVKYDADVVAACVRLVEEQGFQFTP